MWCVWRGVWKLKINNLGRYFYFLYRSWLGLDHNKSFYFICKSCITLMSIHWSIQLSLLKFWNVVDLLPSERKKFRFHCDIFVISFWRTIDRKCWRNKDIRKEIRFFWFFSAYPINPKWTKNGRRRIFFFIFHFHNFNNFQKNCQLLAMTSNFHIFITFVKKSTWSRKFHLNSIRQ